MMERFKPRCFLSAFHMRLSQLWYGIIPFNWQESACSLQLNDAIAFTDGLELTYLWREKEIRICLPQENFCTFLDPALSGLNVAEIVEDWRNVFFQAAQTIIEEIFFQLGEKLAFKSTRWISQENSTMMSLQINKESTPFYCLGIPVCDGNESFFSYFFRKNCPKNTLDWSWLTFPFRVENGNVSLSLNELRSLRCGDVILVPECNQKLRFHWQNLFFEGTIEDKTVCVKTMIMEEENDLPVGIIPEDNVPTDNKEVSEDVSSIDNATEGQTDVIDPTVSIDQLPVNITFDVGRKQLTVEQLKQLHEGYTFELDCRVDEDVKILANGQCIGQGEWVQIEDRLGVRITHLSLKA